MSIAAKQPSDKKYLFDRKTMEKALENNKSFCFTYYSQVLNETLLHTRYNLRFCRLAISKGGIIKKW